MGLRTWLEDQRQLRSVLRSRFKATHILVNELPLMGKFPVLPQPLRWFLCSMAQRFSSALEKELKLENDCQFQDLGYANDVSLMAADGFYLE